MQNLKALFLEFIEPIWSYLTKLEDLEMKTLKGLKWLYNYTKRGTKTVPILKGLAM